MIIEFLTMIFDNLVVQAILLLVSMAVIILLTRFTHGQCGKTK